MRLFAWAKQCCVQCLTFYVSPLCHGSRANSVPPIRWSASSLGEITQCLLMWQKFIVLTGSLRNYSDIIPCAWLFFYLKAFFKRVYIRQTNRSDKFCIQVLNLSVYIVLLSEKIKWISCRSISFYISIKSTNSCCNSTRGQGKNILIFWLINCQIISIRTQH